MIGLGKQDASVGSLISAETRAQTTFATFSSRVLWPFVAALARLDVDAGPTLARVQLNEGQLRDPGERITYAKAYGLIDALVACSGRGDLGLLAAYEVQQGYFDLLSVALRSAPKLGDAIESLLRFFYLLDDGAALTLARGPVFSEMSYVVNCGLPVHPAYIEFIPAMLLLASRRETNVATLGGERIYFQHAAAAPVESYQELFRAPVGFDAAETLAIFRSEVLSLSLCRANESLEQAAVAAIQGSISKA